MRERSRRRADSSQARRGEQGRDSGAMMVANTPLFSRRRAYPAAVAQASRRGRCGPSRGAGRRRRTAQR